MIHLNCGNKWEKSYLDQIIKLNKLSKRVRVSELYGSVANSLRSVRPNYRLPEMRMAEMKEYIKKASDNGIDINYTFNISCFDLKTLKVNKTQYQKSIDRLSDIGVTRFTVASPLLLDLFHFPVIEISTIFNHSNIKPLMAMCNLSPDIDKLCLPIYMNRDFTGLWEINKKLRDIYVRPELIVNEFCVAEKGICVRRDECYSIQSHGGNPKKYFNNYPVGTCITDRHTNPVNWLRAPFILPQDMQRYVDYTGIDHFKVTGRTHQAQSILKIIQYYIEEQFEGSLCSLWGVPLEKIYGMANYTLVDIPVKGLKYFLDEFINQPRKCMDLVCGDDCNYCRREYEKIKKSTETKQEDRRL